MREPPPGKEEGRCWQVKYDKDHGGEHLHEVCRTQSTAMWWLWGWCHCLPICIPLLDLSPLRTEIAFSFKFLTSSREGGGWVRLRKTQGFWSPKLIQFWRHSLRKIQNHQYIIRCNYDYIFKMSKEIRANYRSLSDSCPYSLNLFT